eukprot:TRINITY_DN15067_c0_g1_i3.p1 TRINITY_DN15067_c0_g1~~TRINITY_DN15067_c0_g1_i3.p1  ORF type:complete len:222 (+),score=52.87 TRINITY_DN15067_c0_g1_i3:111-776(+)
MMKHIIGQAIYMIAITLVILFAGEYFLPEKDEIVNGVPISFNGYVRTGRSADYAGNTDDDNLYSTTLYTKKIFKEVGPSRHYTILFSTFVFMQIFNEWNCRKLHDEVNIFAGIQTNYISIAVRFLETLLQVIISQFGGRLFGIYKDGMTGVQWCICIAFSVGTFVVRLILLFIPEDRLLAYGSKELDPLEKRKSVLAARRSASFKRRASIPQGAVTIAKNE